MNIIHTIQNGNRELNFNKTEWEHLKSILLQITRTVEMFSEDDYFFVENLLNIPEIRNIST